MHRMAKRTETNEENPLLNTKTFVIIELSRSCPSFCAVETLLAGEVVPKPLIPELFGYP